ncbi:uncharacterized protein LOC135838093 [Planococcus citri]|uniref:uncharacterized protein LOC135838093 n=1 Tax=Planococcus citri TaxID=170843 RepID=UPI0031F8B5F4
MDDCDLVQRFPENVEKWIYVKSDRKYSIEDDEILDLDSMSLGSDEDTWLYSSDEKSHSNIDIETTPDDEKDSGNMFAMPSNFTNMMNSSISPLSPLIDVNNMSDSLVHLPDVSLGAVNHFLIRTPFEDRKSKPLIKTALCNQFHANHINVEAKSELDSLSMKPKTESNAFQKPDNTFRPSSNDTVLISRKMRSNNEPADKSYVLHSVENKLFTITDADTNETFIKPAANWEPRNQKVNEDESVPNELIDNLKSNSAPVKAAEFSNAKEYEKKSSNKSARTTPENDENDHRSAVKKSVPICQSTPMLLSRYLKYNKGIEETKNFSKWRTSAEFLKEDSPEMPSDGDQNPMNISYIKDTSPIIDEAPPNENENTFSKLENYLNSTYSVQEDDQTSSASESSVSSFGTKPTYSIRDVQKNAELQERNLKQQFQSNYGAASSKSSEISSSNESISAFSPISSSNEGCIDSKIKVSSRNVQKSSFIGRRPHTADNHIFGSNMKPMVAQKGKFLSERTTDHSLLKTTLGAHNDTFRSKLALASGSASPRSRQLNKFEQNTKNVSNSGAFATAETTSQLSSRIRERNSLDSSPNLQNTTFTSKLSMMRAARNDSPSKERKSSDELTKPAVPRRSISPGPVSHIPRPSSRIPKFRSSSSCTRYSNYNSSKK